MTLASRITDLVTAIAVAFNARVTAPASGYDVARLQGYTGTQAQWLIAQQGGMTAAQRAALAGADLWRNRMVTETDTGITWRYVGGTWRQWDSDWITTVPTTAAITATRDYAEYRYTGGRVLYRFAYTLTAAVSGQVTISVPIKPATSTVSGATGLPGGSVPGQIKALRSSSEWLLHISLSSPQSAIYTAVLGTNGAAGPTSATAPLTWASGDRLTGEIEYDYF